jgi:hypothetical protein
MLKFKYKLSPAMSEFIANNVSSPVNSSYLTGYLPDNCRAGSMLAMCKLYIVCSAYADEDKPVLSYNNPVAIVSRSDYEAIQIYNDEFDRNDGTMLFVAEDSAIDAKVEAL